MNMPYGSEEFSLALTKVGPIINGCILPKKELDGSFDLRANYDLFATRVKCETIVMRKSAADIRNGSLRRKSCLFSI